MNDIKIREEVRKKYRTHLLTNRKGEWNKESWGERKIRDTESKGSYTHEGKTFHLYQGIARVNREDWIVVAQCESFDNNPLIFWMEVPLSVWERQNRQ